MARKKLALVAFEQGEGPWVRATGDERAVQVSTLKDGEQVSMWVEGSIGGVHCSTGLTAIQLQAGQMYSFHKTVPEGTKPSKTCVEVLLNG